MKMDFQNIIDQRTPIKSERTHIQEENTLLERLQEESKIILEQNVSLLTAKPDEPESMNDSTPQIKRKKSFVPKELKKRRAAKTPTCDGGRRHNKDGGITGSNSEEGEDSADATNQGPSSLLHCSLLERVLNEKKMALLSSPEVVEFLLRRMREKHQGTSK